MTVSVSSPTLADPPSHSVPPPVPIQTIPNVIVTIVMGSATSGGAGALSVDIKRQEGLAGRPSGAAGRRHSGGEKPRAHPVDGWADPGGKTVA